MVLYGTFCNLRVILFVIPILIFVIPIMKIPTIRFVFARKGLSKKDNKGAVEMVITHERQRRFLSTGVSCYQHQWIADASRNVYVRGTGADIELNQILMSLYQKAYKIVSRMVENDAVDISAIPTLLKRQDANMTFLEYVYERMQKKNVTQYTKKSYISFYNKLSEYKKIKFFSDINEKSIRAFDEWLHNYRWTETGKYGEEVTKQYTQATIGSFHKNMKSFIADAVIDGYLKENVYIKKGIKISKGNTRIDKYLTIDEIERIETATMPTRSLQEAKDLFLVQVYTGMSYIDLMTFDFTKYKTDTDDIVYTGIRHKTKVKFTFALLPKAKEILRKYNYKLPKIPNQKYNQKLKIVADAAHIDKSISSHDGRRSCAYMMLNAGIPIEVVSRVLGHQSVKMTESAYAQILDNTVVKAFKKLENGL